LIRLPSAAGCKVTAHDLRPSGVTTSPNVFDIQGDISDETSIASCFKQAQDHFGPINILCANAGITNEASHPNIWELQLETWEDVYRVNVRGTFLTIKHFLLTAKATQQALGHELENLAIVVTGSECGKFGQAGHAEYASGKAGLQYGLIPTVKNEVVRLNRKARINAVAPGWVNTDLIGDRLDDPRELYLEAQGTVPLRKIAEPKDVAKAVAFLASHEASGHMSGQCLSVDGGMEGRIVWKPEEVLGDQQRSDHKDQQVSIPPRMPPTVPETPKKRIKLAISVDFDAVSGWLGTGAHPDNSTSDYSAGYLSALAGVPRLLKLFTRLGIADKLTWCIPGHSLETFPEQTQAIIASGAEIALHGYAHESASQLTVEQERDVLQHCIALLEKATGKKPRGYRAPLYQLSERTISLLQEHDFLWDSSLSHYDSKPYLLPLNPAPIKPINFSPSAKAKDWMHPSPSFSSLPKSSLVEIPANWYAEDMTPLQFFPHTPNSAGYTDVRVVERMWMDRFEWLRGEAGEGENVVFGLVLHPDTSGMAHVVGMVKRFLEWLRGFGEEVEWCRYEEIAEEFRGRQESVDVR
jgi:NAD(P)-dependent dehydrogenase (short-subunit alcohol dehydrogenase family)/peptidoglycan/xylan/chitin deacetylase (PgdA/CDA1 family)